MNIALICGTGIASATGGELVRHLPVVLAAAVVGAMVSLPALIYLFMPAPGPDRRLAGESFAQFNREYTGPVAPPRSTDCSAAIHYTLQFFRAD